MMNLQGLKSHGRLGVVLPVLLAMLCGTPAAAFQFDLGDAQGSLDSTLSYGLSWRMSDQDKDIIGLTEGGNAYSHNFDDGNLNYDDGDLISNTVKITSELALDYQSVGVFLRGSAFYDFENEDGDRARTKLSNDALDLVGSDAKLLDAYIWGNFEIADMPGQIRLGDQVLSWGESTFIQNGINVINPFDVSAVRVPGAELKEALIPVGMVSASISPTENVTFEGFYQYDWENVEPDPTGSYWSTNDSAGKGGDKVMLGFGQISDLGSDWGVGTLRLPIPPTFPILPWEAIGYNLTPEGNDARFNMVPRGPTVYADDYGQYGLAMRVYAPRLNDTEFGFYFMNYHSRLPVISSKTGTQAGALKTKISATAAGTLAATQNANTAIIAGATVDAVEVAPGVFLPANDPRVLGTEAEQVATNATNATFVGGEALANAFATNEYAQTANYFIEYPEDIKLFGMSFNTVLPESGVALQGEVSHRRDVPLQVDDLELLFATLGPISPGAASLNQLANVQDPTQFSSPYEQVLNGYKRLDVTQVQTTATKLFGPTFGADQFTMVGEVGVTHVHSMPSKDKLRFEVPGTPISGNVPLSGSHYGEVEPSGAFADDTSWGYRLVGKLDFNDAIGAVSLSPRIAWAHDVDGNTPGPGGNFLEHRKAITFGLGASYQSTWSADLSYTDFFGAGRYNLINDRDFVAFNVKYSF
jgi:hypothetical protein